MPISYPLSLKQLARSGITGYSYRTLRKHVSLGYLLGEKTTVSPNFKQGNRYHFSKENIEKYMKTMGIFHSS